MPVALREAGRIEDGHRRIARVDGGAARTEGVQVMSKTIERRLVKLESQTPPPARERKTLDDFYSNPPDMSAFYPPIPGKNEQRVEAIP